MTTTTTSVPELTFQGDTFGKATNDHLREALAEPRFKVRRTETDPYEWLEWVVSPSHPSSGQSCFSVKRVESDGSDGIEQPESSCVPKYANIRPRRIFALFGKSMPEWITQRLTLGDKGVIQAVTNVVDEGFLRDDLSLPAEALIMRSMSHAISTFNPGLSAEEASSAMATALLSGNTLEELSSLFMKIASNCWQTGSSDRDH